MTEATQDATQTVPKDDFISISKAKNLIFEKYPDTTDTEIAIWCFYGRKLGGLGNGDESIFTDAFNAHDNNPIDNPIRHQDPLYYYELDRYEIGVLELESFIPDDRYIGYDALLLRWKDIKNEGSAERFIDLRINDGELENHNMFAQLAGEKTSYAFSLSQIEAIESEYPKGKFSTSISDAKMSPPSSTPLLSAENAIYTKDHLETTTHTLKSRISILSAEINLAMKGAVDSSDANSVWAELTKLAEVKTGVMIGFSSDGIQYRGKTHQDTEIPDVFTKRNLSDRMKREAARSSAKVRMYRRNRQ